MKEKKKKSGSGEYVGGVEGGLGTRQENGRVRL